MAEVRKALLCSDLGEDLCHFHHPHYFDLLTLMREKVRFSEAGEGVRIAVVPDLRTSLYRRVPMSTSSTGVYMRGVSARDAQAAKGDYFFKREV